MDRGGPRGGSIDRWFSSNTYTQAHAAGNSFPNAKTAAGRRGQLASPAAAPESVSPTHAVVLLFVNQTVRIGDAAPNRY